EPVPNRRLRVRQPAAVGAPGGEDGLRRAYHRDLSRLGLAGRRRARRRAGRPGRHAPGGNTLGRVLALRAPAHRLHCPERDHHRDHHRAAGRQRRALLGPARPLAYRRHAPDHRSGGAGLVGIAGQRDGQPVPGAHHAHGGHCGPAAAVEGAGAVRRIDDIGLPIHLRAAGDGPGDAHRAGGATGLQLHSPLAALDGDAGVQPVPAVECTRSGAVHRADGARLHRRSHRLARRAGMVTPQPSADRGRRVGAAGGSGRRSAGRTAL
ncbi:MAG: Cobalt ECF transporter, transmembrane component of energizing module CbiQ, partial [uncultured Chloroflexi bacterium]